MRKWPKHGRARARRNEARNRAKGKPSIVDLNWQTRRTSESLRRLGVSMAEATKAVQRMAEGIKAQEE